MKLNKTAMLLMVPVLVSAQRLSWTVAAKLPRVPGMGKELGLAGVFAGISNDRLLIAGGSNFPGKKPWEGGKKAYTDRVFVLEKRKGNHYRWLKDIFNLKSKIAYGASTITAHGVVCAGGETATANVSDAFILRWDTSLNRVTSSDLPALPIPVTNAGMTAIGEKVYLIGGESNGRPSSKMYLLDLSARALKWEELPDLPLAMSHSVVVTQSNGKNPCIYVIGGRSSTASAISQLHQNAFCYDVVQQKWNDLAPISDGVHSTVLSAAAGVAIGENKIMIISGDKGNIFHQIEVYNVDIAKASNATTKQNLQAAKLQLVTHHAGFSRDVLAYNTITNKWAKAGSLPGYGQVTTTALLWDNAIFIPCGEIMPGVRTPDILRGEMPNDF